MAGTLDKIWRESQRYEENFLVCAKHVARSGTDTSIPEQQKIFSF
jgi:hypothetical protein